MSYRSKIAALRRHPLPLAAFVWFVCFVVPFLRRLRGLRTIGFFPRTPLCRARLDAERKKLELRKREIDLVESRVKVLERKGVDTALDPTGAIPGGGLSPETLDVIRREIGLL